MSLNGGKNASAFISKKDVIPEFGLDEENGEVEQNQTQRLFSSENQNSDDRTIPKTMTKFGSLVTAIRIAKWYAKANGYTSHNRSLYVSQDKESRRRSLSFTQVDSRRFSDVVDEKLPVMQNQKTTLDDSATNSVLSNRPSINTEEVCGWIAKCYGQIDANYHEAYNNEIFRQSRLHRTCIDHLDTL